VVASKVVTADANKDVASFRNITLTGELDAGSLDVSGDADIDGTLEADAITVNGTALSSVIAGTTVTLASTVTVTDSTANTNFPVVFHNESNGLLDDTGALRYNPSTGELLVPNLTVAGTTTTVDTVTMQAENAIVFEGATADAHETTLTIIDPTGDRTINLPNVSGTIPVLAAVSATQITSTPEELNILDGVTSTAAELNILDGVTSTAAELNILDGVTSTAAELNVLDGITAVVGELNALDLGSTAVGTAIASKAVILDSNKDYTGIRNLTITGELDGATLDISGNADIDGTLEADAITIGGTSTDTLYASPGFAVAMAIAL
jgi:cytoskeletal protein CcmA (bactofilin family)